MNLVGRWVRSVDHRGLAVGEFVEEYFRQAKRRVLLIAGAGFDPRSAAVAHLLGQVLGERLSGLFIREERPNPDPLLVSLAQRHEEQLLARVPGGRVVAVPVFDSDGTTALGRHVVSGRHVASLVQSLDLSNFTDIVVDLSALSIGTSFPLTRTLLTLVERLRPIVNLHAMVAGSPETDERISPIPSTFVGPVHGFQGRWGIDSTAKAAKLWLPQLRLGQTRILEELYILIRPDDVVPVLPFPARDPRLSDVLIEHYSREMENEWVVDARNIVYAAENDPLDFYRSVLRLDDARQPVFEGTIGSLIVLSPLGSKVLALGAMLAAMERDLPVMYVEALGYEARLVPERDHSPPYNVEDLVHVWLSGEAYVQSI